MKRKSPIKTKLTKHIIRNILEDFAKKHDTVFQTSNIKIQYTGPTTDIATGCENKVCRVGNYIIPGATVTPEIERELRTHLINALVHFIDMPSETNTKWIRAFDKREVVLNPNRACQLYFPFSATPSAITKDGNYIMAGERFTILPKKRGGFMKVASNKQISIAVVGGDTEYFGIPLDLNILQPETLIDYIERVFTKDQWEVYESYKSLDPDVEKDMKEIWEREGLTLTYKMALMLSRIGQGAFREGVRKLWGGKCAMSGETLDFLWDACHIKPWAIGTDDERLDPSNGIALNGTYHKLFDRGYFGINTDGTIICSSKLDTATKARYNFPTDLKIRLTEEQKPYFKYHMDNIFQS